MTMIALVEWGLGIPLPLPHMGLVLAFLLALNIMNRFRAKKNEIMAYVMSQEFVKRNLKAPATAAFPYANKISTHAIGDCKYKNQSSKKF